MLRPAENRHEFQMIPVALIDPNPENPRENWDRQKVRTLIPTIRRYGLLQPVIVRAVEGGRWQLVAGERRLRAAKEAGLAEIPCVVRTLSDADALMQTFAENEQRRGLSTLEKARAVAKLHAQGLPLVRISRLLGKNRDWAADLVRLLSLPKQWQDRIEKGQLSRTSAEYLLPYRDQGEFLARVERDMAENRWAWRTSDDVKRNLDLLASSADPAANGDGRGRSRRPAASTSVTNGAAGNAGNGAAAGKPPRAPQRMAAEELDALVAAVGNVPTIADLAAVQAAVSRRRVALRRIMEKAAVKG